MNSPALIRTLATLALAFSLGSYSSMITLAPVWISRFPVGTLLRGALGLTFAVLGWSGFLWLVLAFVLLSLTPQMRLRFFGSHAIPLPGVLGASAMLAGIWVIGIVPLTGALARAGHRLQTLFILSHLLSVACVVAIVALEIWGMSALTRMS